MITVTALCPFHPGRYSHAIDLIRPTRVLASKPSQPISAKRWAIGFAAVITGAVWQHACYLPSSRCIERIQRLPIGFCSANQSVPLLSIGTHIIDLIRLFAIAGLISRHWEEHGKIDRPAEGTIAVLCGDGLIARPRAKRMNLARCLGFRPRKTQAYGGWQGKCARWLINDLLRLFRGGFCQNFFGPPEILAAAFPENSGRPWNAPRWPSGLRGFVFPVRRYPDAAEHNSRSVIPLWLRGGL